MGYVFEDGIVEFDPPAWLRPTMVQTGIASMKFRRWGRHVMEADARTHILDCGDGVRLQGSLSRHPEEKAFFIYLHGWEGSEQSTYVVSSARRFYDMGCSVFRLNFRDHGDTHHLNVDMFHSARLDEVANGVRMAATLSASVPIYIIGFSLGGNFALRLARMWDQTTIPNLVQIISISPVINPLAASQVIDNTFLIRRYFYKKWVKSLRKKQAAFPEIYDFSSMIGQKSIISMTEEFLSQFTDFPSSENYFNSYRIWPDDLKKCVIDTTIIMAKDDPVIPVDDLLDINISSCVTKILCAHGGHNGFFSSLLGPTWYDDYIQTMIVGERE